MGLLEKAQLKHQQEHIVALEVIEEETSPSNQNQKTEKKTNKVISKFNDPFEIMEEKKGFGWNGLGIRQIIKLQTTGEFLYKVIEPTLNPQEKEIKKELSHLFKMLADVNVAYKEPSERNNYLQSTLEQIVTDNNITFYPVEKKEKEKKSFKQLFSFSKKEKKEETKPVKQQEKKENFFQSLSTTITKTFDKQQRAEEKERLEAYAKESRDKIFYHVFREFIGYGRIDIIMMDEGIEDVSCDGPDVPIFLYHKKYEQPFRNIY